MKLTLNSNDFECIDEKSSYNHISILGIMFVRNLKFIAKAIIVAIMYVLVVEVNAQVVYPPTVIASVSSASFSEAEIAVQMNNTDTLWWFTYRDHSVSATVLERTIIMSTDDLKTLFSSGAELLTLNTQTEKGVFAYINAGLSLGIQNKHVIVYGDFGSWGELSRKQWNSLTSQTKTWSKLH